MLTYAAQMRGLLADYDTPTGLIWEMWVYRWGNEYSGLRIDQARRPKRLETDNGRLRRAVADLTLDNQILREAAEGNF